MYHDKITHKVTFLRVKRVNVKRQQSKGMKHVTKTRINSCKVSLIFTTTRKFKFKGDLANSYIFSRRFYPCHGPTHSPKPSSFSWRRSKIFIVRHPIRLSYVPQTVTRRSFSLLFLVANVFPIFRLFPSSCLLSLCSHIYCSFVRS